MKGGNNVNGTGMAVLMGIILIIAAFVTPIDFLARVGMFAFGIISFFMGLAFSQN